MYPSVFPGEWDIANPEFLVYQELKRLGDRYRVFYSKRLKGISEAKDECEIDFIVFNGSDVLLCIEVKGGQIRYDGVQRKWFQNDKVLDPSPDGQASASTHALIKYLGTLTRSLNIDWALCFPNCQLDIGRTEISEIPSVLIVDETKLIDVESSIGEIESYTRHKWGKRGLTSGEAEKLVQMLTRSLGFVERLGVRIARNNQQILEVTREQFELLEFVELNKRSLISGAAGTGKTLLAQELAKRRVADGNSVLLLFFNKAIARKARFAFDKQSSVEVRTFHSFARRLIDECDANWWSQNSAKANEFWNMAVPLKLLELPPEKLPKFDVIIVDEGQDFKPEWFEFLEGLLKDEDRSSFFVFLDERQDIFHHWNGIPLDIKPFRTPLRKNCRNTRAIVEYLNREAGSDMRPFERSPVGTRVVERFVRNQTDEQTQIVRDLKDLIENHDVKPGSIVILANKSKAESCLSQTKTIGKHNLVSIGKDYEENSHSVQYATISVFKGLEADVVFMIDTDALSPEQMSTALYVQGSRARNLLYVYRARTEKGD